MKSEITRSTLGQVNRGLCASRNNCRYKGTTPVYRIAIEHPDGELAYYATTLWLADGFRTWLYYWDGKGDAEIAFAQSDTSLARKYLDTPSAKLEPCF